MEQKPMQGTSVAADPYGNEPSFLGGIGDYIRELLRGWAQKIDFMNQPQSEQLHRQEKPGPDQGAFNGVDPAMRQQILARLSSGLGGRGPMA